MDKEELQQVLQQVLDKYLSLSQPSYWTKYGTLFATITSVIAIFVAFWNVHRASIRARENELVKGTREYKVKTADEVMEAISNMDQVYRHFTVTEQRLDRLILNCIGDVDEWGKEMERQMLSLQECADSVRSKLERRRYLFEEHFKSFEAIYNGIYSIDQLVEMFKQSLGIYPPLSSFHINNTAIKDFDFPPNIYRNDEKTIVVNLTPDYALILKNHATAVDQEAKKQIGMLQSFSMALQEDAHKEYKELYTKAKRTWYKKRK